MAKQAVRQSRQRSAPVRVSENATTDSSYEGQLGVAEIGEILKAHRANAAETRLAFLEAHPHYIACSVAGCEGLVGPNYQRLSPDGRKYGFCPRRQVHARLMPQVFAGR